MYPLTYFSRHGQTDWNVEKRLQGQMETDINPLGQAQADGNGRRLAQAIKGDPASYRYVASPMRRTRETMERIRRNMGLDPLVYETDRLLMELSFGDWEGHTFAELDALKPGTSHLRDSGKWNFCPPGEGAESYAMLAARVARWLEGLERPTVCVTHGGIIRSLFHLVEGMDGEEAATLNVPQDRLLVLEGNRLSWV
ncbi:MAG: histidine phosphatase family protein [Notoacmeibacter sp.]|nr:histidine phosphatase family protein [Notoacmeibacter sp.]MCC0033005.1 histidine phosphatase family protein [Brucellaceae bacterium]